MTYATTITAASSLLRSKRRSAEEEEAIGDKSGIHEKNIDK